MCEVCKSNGYVREALSQDISDRAVRLKMCPKCKGIDSKLEIALQPLKMSVVDYFQRAKDASKDANAFRVEVEIDRRFVVFEEPGVRHPYLGEI